MDYKRTFLYAALFFVLYSLWMAWQTDYPTNSSTNGQTASVAEKNNLIPHLNDSSESNSDTNKTNPVTSKAQLQQVAASRGKVINIKTDVLNVQIDTSNGDVIGAELVKYPLSLQDKKQPFVLLSDGLTKYTANSSLFVKKNGEVKNLAFGFTADKKSYTLAPGQKKLAVTLTGESSNGLKVTKTFSFSEGSYLVDVDYKINNQGSSFWQGYLNTQLLRQAPSEDKSSLFHVGSYNGASMSDPSDKLYKKISYSNMDKKDFARSVESGWIAMQEHYFLSAWIPTNGSKNYFYTRVVNDQYVIGTISSPLKLQSGQSMTTGARLYVGPELTDVLQNIAPGLDLTVDYGWLWFISKYLFVVMNFIHGLVGNWGWSIVLVTMLIKLAFYRLSAKSYRSMASMRKLQPKLEALKQRCGDDKAKLSQATMELYRNEKVNPLGGCLPILIQIPVFIGLYWVLLESVQLRQAPFIFWIHDLAAKDPYYILPILMGATMFIQQKLNPPPPDPTQAKVMMMLPVLFTFLFLSFPAGLVLYWVVNNSLSILQQWYITKKYSDKPVKKNKNNPKLALSK